MNITIKSHANKFFSAVGIALGFFLLNFSLVSQSEHSQAFSSAVKKLRAEKSGSLETPVVVASIALPDAAFFANSIRLTFNDLREYRYSRRAQNPVPEKLKALVGKEVDIAGYMIPMSEALDVTEFMLVQMPFFGCCYSVPPEPNETVMVKLVKGKKTEYVYTPIRVRGKFKIEQTSVDNFVISLYQIDAEAVTPTSPNDKDVVQHQNGTPLPGAR